VNKAEVREGRYKIEVVLVAEDEALVLTSTATCSSCSATGGPGDLFFTTSVENIEPPLYTGHYLHERQREGPHELPW
jgi:hypothetical protein